MSKQLNPPNDVESNLNIKAGTSGHLLWNPSDIPGSLQTVAAYAEAAADKAIDWYWRNKRWKARLSQGIQLGALVSTALAGLIPVLVVIVPGIPVLQNTGLAASLLVGLAASLIGLDKAFGLSSGWARYVLTATNIRKGLEEFRMDWTLLRAKAGAFPSNEDIMELLQRAKDFTGFVESLVLQETKDWVTEFQNNIAQLEKETKAQIDALKSQAEKTIAAKTAASQPGSVEIAVSNFDKTDNRSFKVLWEGTQGKIAEETVNNAQEWIRINVPAGQYTATVSSTIGGKPAGRKSVVVVNPGEHKQIEVALPLSLAATN